MTKEMTVYLEALLKLIDNAPEKLNIFILAGDEGGLHTLQNCCDESANILFEAAYHLRGGNAAFDEDTPVHKGTETVQ